MKVASLALKCSRALKGDKECMNRLYIEFLKDGTKITTPTILICRESTIDIGWENFPDPTGYVGDEIEFCAKEVLDWINSRRYLR